VKQLLAGLWYKVNIFRKGGFLGTCCHGLFVRCGETSSQVPRSGLYLRWEMSSRIFSGILYLVVILTERIEGVFDSKFRGSKKLNGI
jgi:hypothetical protein